MRHSVIALTLPFALSLSGLLATQLAAQDASVAEAARRAQEQKKSTSKPAKVITNDSMPATSSPDPANPAATPPAPSPDAATQPATTGATGAPDAATADAKTSAVHGEGAAQPDNAPANPEVATLKRQIADQQKQVDLLLRLYSLDQDAFLSNPNHAKDEQGKGKLDAQQEEIRAKVAEVAALKAKLEAIAPGESAKPAAPKP